MAEGQKPVRNTLLSGAAGNNFFEDATLLVPVPLAAAQPPAPPATAEIDLSSEESLSNRGSIEREMEQISLNDSPVDEPAAPISLFSRAATGIDAFSKLLSRDSSTSCSTSGTDEPAVVTLLPPKSKLQPSRAPPEPPVVTLLPVQGLRTKERTIEPPTAVSLFAAPTPESSNSTIQPINTWPPTIDSMQASRVYMNPRDFPNASQTPSNLSFASTGTTGGMSQSDLSNYVILGPNDMDGSLGNASCMQPTVPLISKPAVGIDNPPYNFPKSPLDSAAPIRPPSNTAGTSNSFRLGSQRPKYAEYPEFQEAPIAAPIQSPVPTPTPVYDPHNINAILNSNPGPFYAPVPNFSSATPSEVSNTSLYFSSPPSSGRTSTPPALTPPMLTQNSYVRPPLSMIQPTSYYSAAGIQQYGPMEVPALTYHWFHRKDIDAKVVWKPFSIIDSVALEDVLANDPERLVPTDGGRYDVSVSKKLKFPVYWEETPVDVRRGSWFYKGPMDNKFIPYDEEFAVKLEKEYSDCMSTGTWQKRLEFSGGESVILHSSNVIVHFCQAAAPDDWGNLPESQIRPRVVKRGIDEIEVEDGESTQIDHLVFVVHGIGPICDFKLRNIVEAVDDFRGLSIQLIHSHFRESIEKNLVGRVEFLPVSWHKSLHGDKGIDEQLKRITLRSIPKFRDFTNDTLLDILFYTSPVYCQTVIDSVSSELNRLYKLFLSRNPTFKGKVSLTGHSLGSLILFDLLVHQPTISVNNSAENDLAVQGKSVDLCAQAHEADGPVSSSSSRTVSYTVGTAGTGQPFISYPILDFSPAAFFALGSPIAMFVTVRGIEKLGNDFHFPTCPAFFNIFHPYDPVAYRIETMIDPSFESRPVLIPHHKGRKRIHLELKETMARVGADIKQRVMDAVKNTWNTVYQYTGLVKTHEHLETEIQTAIADELVTKSESEGIEDANASIPIGSLNGGRRIDHVLQEAPYETFNEYVFAMSTHVGYWESEDTMLLILTEVYNGMGIQCDRVISATPGMASPSHHGQVQNVNGAVPYRTGPRTMAAQFPTSYHPSAPLLESNIHATEQYTQPALGHSTYGSPAMHQQPLQSIPMLPQESQPIPMLTRPMQSNEVFGAPSTSMYQQGPSQRPSVIGNRPVVDPTQFPRGMDPTAPMPMATNVVPPPKMGFVPKQN